MTHFSHFLNNVTTQIQAKAKVDRFDATGSDSQDSHADGSIIDPGEGNLPLLALLLAHECAVCQAPDAGWQLAYILLRLLCF